MEQQVLDRIKKQEETALLRKGSFSFGGTPYEAQEWFICGNMAEQAGLSEEAMEYRKRAIYVYEENNCLSRAKAHAKSFGFTELENYYEKLMQVKSERP